MRARCFAYVLLAAFSGCGEVAGTATLSETVSIAPAGRLAEKTCRPVRAMATGFGERKVTGFAEANLQVVIDKTKDAMAAKGAKGFSVEGQTVKCEDYIDFGGSIGREHKCHATAQLCGQSG